MYVRARARTLACQRKDLASFQIDNGGERRRGMRVGARSGIEPRTFASALTNCASCPLRLRVILGRLQWMAPAYRCRKSRFRPPTSLARTSSSKSTSPTPNTRAGFRRPTQPLLPASPAAAPGYTKLQSRERALHPHYRSSERSGVQARALAKR